MLDKENNETSFLLSRDSTCDRMSTEELKSDTNYDVIEDQ